MVIHYRFRFPILFFLLVTFSAYATIRDVHSIHDIFSPSTNMGAPTLTDGTILTPDDFVLFDLDNTLIEPDNDDLYGSDAWLSAYAKKEAQQQEISIDQAFNEVCLPHYFEIQQTLPLRLVEAASANYIRLLQESGVPVFALTARSQPVIEVTLKQLSRLNIDFYRHEYARLSIPFTGNYHAQFIHGIFFGGNNKKSALLKSLVESLPHKPHKIIFIDDKKHHIEDIYAAAQELGVAISCYRYGYVDEKVQRYLEQHG